jgi:hypothetical protein
LQIAVDLKIQKETKEKKVRSEATSLMRFFGAPTSSKRTSLNN